MICSAEPAAWYVILPGKSPRKANPVTADNWWSWTLQPIIYFIISQFITRILFLVLSTLSIPVQSQSVVSRSFAFYWTLHQHLPIPSSQQRFTSCRRILIVRGRGWRRIPKSQSFTPETLHWLHSYISFCPISTAWWFPRPDSNLSWLITNEDRQLPCNLL